jgi:hypothetical protein
MADDTLKQTAEQLRAAVEQAKGRGDFAPAGQRGQGPAVDVPALAAAVEAQLSPALTALLRAELDEKVGGTVSDAVSRALAEHPSQTAQIDPELVARLETAAQKIATSEGDSDVMLHLRNILPGQIHQDLQVHNQALMHRIAVLEGELAAMQVDLGWGREFLRLALVGLVVAFVMIGVSIFERQIQNWGRDTIYPLFGISIKEASPSTPRPAVQSVPTERR